MKFWNSKKESFYRVYIIFKSFGFLMAQLEKSFILHSFYITFLYFLNCLFYFLTLILVLGYAQSSYLKLL